MKALHFEKYSKHFVSLYDRLSDFASEVWDSYFVENLIKFPMSNIMNHKEKGSFYSSQRCHASPGSKKTIHNCLKIREQQEIQKDQS